MVERTQACLPELTDTRSGTQSALQPMNMKVLSGTRLFMNTKYKLSAVIFDMDGLLLDSEKIALASFRETCAHFGLGDLTPVFMQCVGTNQASCVQVLKKELQGKTDYLAFERLWNEKYSLATVSAIPLKDGVIELLNEIEKWGLRTAVATSTVTLKARQKLEKSGILHRFEFIVGGDQVE